MEGVNFEGVKIEACPSIMKYGDGTSFICENNI